MFGALKIKRSAGVRVTRGVHAAIAAGNAARARSQWASAARHYARALAGAPDLTHIWIQAGHMHKEDRAWEHAVHAYAQAAELAPADPDVIGWLFEIAGRLGDDERRGVTAALEASFPAIFHQRPSDAASAGGVAGEIVFDVSDLVAYFARARVPTGIQRVQIEVIRALEKDAAASRICCAIEGRDAWVEIPADVFRRITRIATGGDRYPAAAWVEALAALQLSLLLGDPMVFGTGATLLNLGTSWWLQNYFLQIRNAQAESGIHYVPFVHDLIPIMAPQHCVGGLVEDFVFWATSVFTHAGRFLANSEATKRDLLTVAGQMGHAIGADAVTVVRLDAGFAKPDRSIDAEATLHRFGLDGAPFVLFVSTIESRKDHLAALRVWQRLLSLHGAACPVLVCVGNDGWLNEPFYALLESDPVLRRQVVLLTRISDRELGLMYERCLFTIYPSSYEGWGLPITEALSYGKPVVAADNSSLPEAGGALATYFRTGDLDDFTRCVERFCFDEAYRAAVSRAIVERYRPRAWADVARQITAAVSAPRPETVKVPDRGVAAGWWYDLSRSRNRTVWRGCGSAEVFRVGRGWADVDRDGAWIRADRASLALDLPGDGPLTLLLLLSARIDVAYRVEVDGAVADTGTVAAGERRWVKYRLPENGGGCRSTMVDIACRADDGTRPSRALRVLGFAITRAGDGSEHALLEAITLGRLDRITAFRHPSGDAGGERDERDAYPPASAGQPGDRTSVAAPIS